MSAATLPLQPVQPVDLGAHDLAQLLGDALLMGEGDLELGQRWRLGRSWQVSPVAPRQSSIDRRDGAV